VKLALALAPAFAAAACTSAPKAPLDAELPQRGNGSCNAAPTQQLVGELAGSDLGSRALSLSGARTLRWLQPGQIVTMEYRSDRLDIVLDGSNHVRAIRCG